MKIIYFIIPFLSLIGWLAGTVMLSNYEKRQPDAWVMKLFLAISFGVIGIIILLFQ